MQANTVSVTLDVEDLATPLKVHGLRGVEGMNTLYSFQIEASSGPSSLELDAIVGKRAVITFENRDLRRYVHGIVSFIEVMEAGAELTMYELTLVPPTWLLAQGSQCRIMQGVTTKQVIERVFAEAGLRGYRLSLQGARPARDVCIQYQESDWAFLSRLMEEEGIFYFFEHGSEGSTLVIADHVSAHEPIGAPDELPYGSSPADGGECVPVFRIASAVRPGKVAVRDVPFDTPTKPNNDEAASTRDTNVELFAYPALGRAQDRLDALQVGRNVARGAARSVRLAPGSTFKLGGHPRASFDADYLLMNVEHSLVGAEDGSVYTCNFRCVLKDTPCRPEAKTPKPRILGPQSARVVGPQGMEIYVNERGCVLIKLEWDRSDAGDLTSACWAPVSQASAGANHGAMNIPRVGSYVLVEFLNGDPDRPVITGRVYNSVSPYPYALPAEKSKTTLKSLTTPGGDGHNELRFEDQRGKEQVYLRAQRNLDLEALHDATRKVGHDDGLQVSGSRSATIGGAETQVVGLSQTLTVGVAQAITVGASRALAIGGDHTESVTGDHTESVGGDRTTSVTGALAESVGGARSLSIAGKNTEKITGNRSISVGGKAKMVIAGNELHEVGGNQIVAVLGNQQQIVEGEVSHLLGALTTSVEGATCLQGTGEVKIESGTATKIGGPYVLVSGDSTIYLRAYDKIVLEVASSEDEDADSAKLEISKDGVYITNGNATKKITGDHIAFNC